MHDHPDCLAKKEGWVSRAWETWVMNPSGLLVFKHDIPNYLNDLNAMHEAEKVLIERGDEVMLDYDQELHLRTDGWKWNATAAQRASAFLETLGLWEEAKNEG